MNKFNWNKYQTDKDKFFSNGHHYGQFYDKYFGSFRKEFKGILLEVGSRIGSAKLWLDYFPNAKSIICADQIPFTHSDKRFEFLKFNQLSNHDNSSVIQKNNDISIVIDDGPHTPDAQLTSLQNMLPLLNSDSWFVIEDMHCTEPHNEDYHINIKDSDISVGDLLKEWQIGVYKKYKYLSEPELIEELDLEISIEIGRKSEIAFIYKK